MEDTLAHFPTLLQERRGGLHEALLTGGTLCSDDRARNVGSAGTCQPAGRAPESPRCLVRARTAAPHRDWSSRNIAECAFSRFCGIRFLACFCASRWFWVYLRSRRFSLRCLVVIPKHFTTSTNLYHLRVLSIQARV